MNRPMRTLMVVALAMLEVVGCVASAPAQSTPASSAPLGSPADIQALRERAAAYWAARLAGDLRTQWELLEPRGSGRLTAEEYGAGRSVRYLGYQVEDATVRGFFATVKVRVLFQPNLPPSASSRVVPPMVSVAADGWVRIGGIWYHSLEEGESGPSQARQP
jgi:hypothetical protein